MLVKQWQTLVAHPARESGLEEPQLVVLASPFRFIIGTLVNYTLDLVNKNPGRTVAVVIPELVESRWYHYLLHNQRAALLKARDELVALSESYKRIAGYSREVLR